MITATTAKAPNFMRTMTASTNLAAHPTITTHNVFHPSPAWEQKMILLEQIHAEIAPHESTSEEERDSVEIDYLLD
jgi:hypothetical protein